LLVAMTISLESSWALNLNNWPYLELFDSARNYV
jgi:hypothetical protein